MFLVYWPVQMSRWREKDRWESVKILQFSSPFHFSALTHTLRLMLRFPSNPTGRTMQLSLFHKKWAHFCPKGFEQQITLPSGWTFLSSRDAYWSICMLSGIFFTIFRGVCMWGIGRERDEVKLAKMLIILETRLWVHSGLLLFSFLYMFENFHNNKN